LVIYQNYAKEKKKKKTCFKSMVAMAMGDARVNMILALNCNID